MKLFSLFIIKGTNVYKLDIYACITNMICMYKCILFLVSTKHLYLNEGVLMYKISYLNFTFDFTWFEINARLI